MANPFLRSLYTFNRRGNFWEINYPFQATSAHGPLNDALNAGGHIYFVITRDDGLTWAPLPYEPDHGWRVPVGKGYVYLHIEEQPMPPQEAAKIAGDVHLRLLQASVYGASHDDILTYWTKPDDDFNRAEDYASPSALDRSEYLFGLIDKYLPGSKSALEVGCNIGRNLNYLQESHSFQVAGLEISGHALTLLKTTYPKIAEVTLYEGDAAKRITEIEDARFDIVYSMAVLMHMHPQTDPSLWENIVRVAKKGIVTIENETASTDRNWVRDYEALFSPFGAVQIHTEIPPPSMPAFGGYRTRVFAIRR